MRAGKARGGVALLLGLGLLAGCSGRVSVNAEGAIIGTASRVWEDGMRLDVGDGRSVRVDTWAVCGDRTSQAIRPGDAVHVWATPDLLSYDAWRITDPSGNPVCG